MKEVHKNCWWKTLNENDLGNPRLRRENNFKWILKEIEHERVDSIYLTGKATGGERL
jgi:hypothetical protein